MKVAKSLIALLFATTVNAPLWAVTEASDVDPLTSSLLNPLEDKKNKIEVSPLGAMVGNLALSYSYMLNKDTSLGVMLAGAQAVLDDYKMNGYSVGALATHKLTRYADHPLLRGELAFGRYNFKKDTVEKKADHDLEFMNTRGLVGYSWNWANGLGVLVAGGVGYTNGITRGTGEEKLKLGGGRVSVDPKNKTYAIVHPDAEFTVGYTF